METIMSEKSLSRMEAGTIPQPDTNTEKPSKRPWSKSWTRFFKTITFLAACSQAGGIHKWSFNHATAAQHARWDELVTLWCGGVENLEDWVRLFLGISNGRTTPAIDDFKERFVWLLLSVLSFWLYAKWYASWCRDDRYQRQFLIGAAMVSVFAVPALASLGVGYFISSSFVVPDAVLLALLASDAFHWVRPEFVERLVEEKPVEERPEEKVELVKA